MMLFSDSIGNILTSSTYPDFHKVTPNISNNLLQGILFLQDELFTNSIGTRQAIRRRIPFYLLHLYIKLVVSILQYTHMWVSIRRPTYYILGIKQQSLFARSGSYYSPITICCFIYLYPFWIYVLIISSFDYCI